MSLFDRSGLTAAFAGHDSDRYPMARGNLAAETNAHRFSQAGGTGIVVRFGWFHGPGAAHSEQLFALARRHLGLVLGPPSSYVSSIHVAAAAAAVAAALRAPGGDVQHCR